MDSKKITNYIFELGALKKFEHSGFKMAGIKTPDTIAEHVFRTALIGYILAKEEKADEAKVVLTCLLHDNGEARITDLHKVAARYIDSKKAEMTAFSEQCQNLPEESARLFVECFKEYEERKTKEGIISRDADLLETAFQSKEYIDIGYEDCKDWIDNVGKRLKTESAIKLWKTLKKTRFTEWWEGLKKIN